MVEWPIMESAQQILQNKVNELLSLNPSDLRQVNPVTDQVISTKRKKFYLTISNDLIPGDYILIRVQVFDPLLWIFGTRLRREILIKMDDSAPLEFSVRRELNNKVGVPKSLKPSTAIANGALLGLIIGGYVGFKTYVIGRGVNESVSIAISILIFCSLVPLILIKSLKWIGSFGRHH